MLEAEGTDEAYGRIENLDELSAVAEEVEVVSGEGTLEAFLEHLALITDVDTWQERADRVTLMTLHSAKGLEFPVVVLAGLEEGLFPHVRSLEEEAGVEEERRLCYVGMTRAQQRLVLTYAHQRAAFGTSRPGLPSRFLAEIPAEMLVRTATQKTATGDWPDEDRPVPDVAAGDLVRHKTFGAGPPRLPRAPAPRRRSCAARDRPQPRRAPAGPRRASRRSRSSAWRCGCASRPGSPPKSATGGRGGRCRTRPADGRRSGRGAAAPGSSPRSRVGAPLPHRPPHPASGHGERAPPPGRPARPPGTPAPWRCGGSSA